MGLPEDKHLL